MGFSKEEEKITHVDNDNMLIITILEKSCPSLKQDLVAGSFSVCRLASCMSCCLGNKKSWERAVEVLLPWSICVCVCLTEIDTPMIWVCKTLDTRVHSYIGVRLL